MTSTAFLTTSWDDGHPNDFRVADLLQKYDLPGTFYIPRTSEFGTMSEPAISELGSRFEIGAHTLNHVVLTQTDDSTANREIADSKAWLENLLGADCTVFCYPQGKFRKVHLSYVREAGFLGARTVELVATRTPTGTGIPLIMPTSIQALAHPRATYIRNLLKRRAMRGLWTYARLGAPLEWESLAELLLYEAQSTSGTFHLWGHSWELREEAQWARLETVLGFISELRFDFNRVTNGGLCRQLLAAEPPDS